MECFELEEDYDVVAAVAAVVVDGMPHSAIYCDDAKVGISVFEDCEELADNAKEVAGFGYGYDGVGFDGDDY